MSVRNVIEVENLSKRYILGETKFSNTSTAKKGKQAPPDTDDGRVDGNVFWALRNISFSVKQGEVMGIIGKNGAGKSTLLKILSHITTPTSGKVKIKGSFASLLEVGTGFHPDLTGRENIYLNGAILGLTRSQISTHLDSIVDFSGIQHHIDSPVKRYSSGMKVRLGFAVAAHLSPDILIIDEVLAVGDVEFQAKCLGKIGEVTESGRTVLFVSHNMAAVRTLCSSSVLLEGGKITAIGPTAEVMDKYLITNNSIEGQEEMTWEDKNNPGLEEIKLLSIRTLNENNELRGKFYSSQSLSIEITYKVERKISGSRCFIQIKDNLNVIAFTSTNQIVDGLVKLPGTYVTNCIIPPNLLNHGRYSIILGMDVPDYKWLIKPITTLAFDVILMGNSGSLQENWPGVLAPLLKWETTQLKHQV